MIHEIFKNKGTSSLCANYRDVMLANDNGKFVGKFCRRQLVSRARRLIFPSQFWGGFHGGETAFAHLYIECILNVCKAQAIAGVIFFLDVIAAFASMLRVHRF